MRTHRRSVAVLSALLLLGLSLAACAPAATPSSTPAPTATGTPSPMPTPTHPAATPTSRPTSTPTPSPMPETTPTPSPSPKPTPIPKARYTLPKACLPYIGIGTNGWAIMKMAGREDSPSGSPDAAYLLEGGGKVTLEYASYGGYKSQVYVVGITVVDASGTHVRKAGARSDPREDSPFLFTKGTFTLANLQSVAFTDLVAALGEPVLDEWDYGYTFEPEDGGWYRDVTFPGLQVELFQAKDAADKGIWRTLDLKATDAAFSTSVGWRVGQSAAESVAAAGSVDWVVVPTVGPDGTLIELAMYYKDLSGYGPCAVLHFTHDVLVSIQYSIVSVGA